MIGLLLKDLRLMMAAPLVPAAVIIWSCFIIGFTKLLPLPTPQIDVALMSVPVCAEQPEEDECPYPESDILAHAITDIPDVRYHGIAPFESDIYRHMDDQALEIVLAWHSTLAGRDLVEEVIDVGAYEDAESGGVWVAYTRSRTQAETAQIRYIVRQIQGTGLLTANARRRGRAPGIPSIGAAESFSEFGPIAIAIDKEAEYDRAADLRDIQMGAVLEAAERRLADYSNTFETEISEQNSEQLMRIFRAQLRSQSYSGQRLFALGLQDAVNNDPRTPDLQISRAEAEFFAIALSAGDRLSDGDADMPLKATPFLIVEQSGPARDDSTWLVPGLIAIIAVSLAFTFSAVATVREREHGTEHFLFASHLAAWENPLLIKPLAPSVLAFVCVMVMLLFSQSMLGFSVKSGVVSALLLIALGILTGAAHGLIAGSLVRNQADASALSGAYLISLLLFGDVFIPMQEVIAPASLMASALPVSHLNGPWSDWMTWGASIRVADFGPLILLFMMSLTVAALALRVRRRRV